MKVKMHWKRSIDLGKGLLLSYISTFILILIFSLLVTYSNISESRTSLLNSVVMIISITLGSIYLVTKTKEKGWIYGGVLGIAYYLILLGLNLIFIRPLILDLFSLTKFIFILITGVIGGIIGINIST